MHMPYLEYTKREIWIWDIAWKNFKMPISSPSFVSWCVFFLRIFSGWNQLLSRSRLLKSVACWRGKGRTCIVKLGQRQIFTFGKDGTQTWSSRKIVKDSVPEVKVTLSSWHKGIPERHNRSTGGRLSADGKGQICTVKDLRLYPHGTRHKSLFAEALCCRSVCSGKRKANRSGEKKKNSKQNDKDWFGVHSQVEVEMFACGCALACLLHLELPLSAPRTNIRRSLYSDSFSAFHHSACLLSCPLSLLLPFEPLLQRSACASEPCHGRINRVSEATHLCSLKKKTKNKRIKKLMEDEVGTEAKQWWPTVHHKQHD